MKIVRGKFKDISLHLSYAVVGLGSFDGIHIGHQALIRGVIKRAKQKAGQSIIYTFEDHPLVKKQKAPFLLTTTQEKLELLDEIELDYLVLVPFSKEFSLQLPEEFVSNVISSSLGAKEVIVGFNYTFGFKKSGDALKLQELSKAYGFDLTILPDVRLNHKVVSSSLIRQLISLGRVNEASRFLGYSYFVKGVVKRGSKRGKELLFPTANLEITDPHKLLPKDGVYACYVFLDREVFKGVSNIGLRPTFDEKKRCFEIHLIDFDKDIYSSPLLVFFVEKLRDEIKFGRIEDLKDQIRKDIEKTKEILKVKKPSTFLDSFYIFSP